MEMSLGLLLLSPTLRGASIRISAFPLQFFYRKDSDRPLGVNGISHLVIVDHGPIYGRAPGMGPLTWSSRTLRRLVQPLQVRYQSGIGLRAVPVYLGKPTDYSLGQQDPAPLVLVLRPLPACLSTLCIERIISTPFPYVNEPDPGRMVRNGLPGQKMPSESGPKAALVGRFCSL
jgi:hypothetical protein